MDKDLKNANFLFYTKLEVCRMHSDEVMYRYVVMLD